ncbi:MAG: GNAT family N-acetyltransferase [Thermoplasmatales archaeon]|nr:GNAT family N-acetyltransferase [Candidatus Thermoplasmatota archaeon]MCL6003425.1 GNAT family N-acetyltransferase [Candidatus Thermoplasmatota archaeon]MDA8056220.1 GNAT family N-acetyltransferase [Thermoplasmatales archaeon]
MIRDVQWNDMQDLVNNYYSYYGEMENEYPDMGLIFYHSRPEFVSEIDWFSTFFRDIQAGNAIGVVAEEDGKVIGLCDVHRKRPDSDVSHIGILGIAIRKEFRDKGLGRQMMEAIIERCRGKFDMIVLDVFSNNQQAISLYKKLGFIEYAHLPRGTKRGNKFYDEISMYYDL